MVLWGVTTPGDQAGRGGQQGWAVSAAGAGGWLSPLQAGRRQPDPSIFLPMGTVLGDGIEEDAGRCKAGMQSQAM